MKENVAKKMSVLLLAMAIVLSLGGCGASSKNFEAAADTAAPAEEFKAEYDEIVNSIPDLPFSNLWIAQHSRELIPNGSVMHFGILNSLRSWNFFETDKSILGYSN